MWIGKVVEVIVDRKLGTKHPRADHIHYYLNYGYIENTIAPDGSEQDVYIMGIDYPLDTFVGEVIAIIHRKDDVEDKLVVAPIGTNYTDEEIIEATNFVEQFYEIEILRNDFKGANK